MKIFDLHNDALTGGGTADRNNVIYAIWTTLLTESVVIETAKKASCVALEDLGGIDIYSALSCSPLYCGLTWNGFNGLAGGALTDESLTARGRQYIAELNRANVAVDLAHLNRRSFYRVVEIADRVICSHTAMNCVNNHPRNLTNNQISVIIEKCGVVGLCLVGKFLGEATIQRFLTHIDAFTDKFGDENLCIGTDFYGTDDIVEGIFEYKNFDRIVLGMIKRGYSDKSIKRILYENAQNYFGEI